MAALVIAAAGSALGGAVLGTGVVALGLTGNAIGYLAGSLLASAFTPAQKSEGPRLNDLQVSGSSYGATIPYLEGHPRVAGQIVWASTKREIATTTSVGKGGGGSSYTSFTYEVDVLILFSDNVGGGVARVWRDGDLVWSGIGDTETIMASGSNQHWSRLTSYPGSSTQLPDPTYEAAVGTANAPAYRGRETVFIQGLQLGGGGNLPNLTFERGTSQTGTVAMLAQFNTAGTETFRGPMPTNANYTLVRQSGIASSTGNDWTLEAWGWVFNALPYNDRAGIKVPAMFGDASAATQRDGKGTAEHAVFRSDLNSSFDVPVGGDFTFEIVHDAPASEGIFSGSSTGYCVVARDVGTTGSWHLANIYNAGVRTYVFNVTGAGGLTGTAITGRVRIRVTRRAGTMRMFFNGTLVASVAHTAALSATSGLLQVGGLCSNDGNYTLTDCCPGLYDELLFVSGVAIGIADYTPATVEYAPASQLTVSSVSDTTVQAVVSNLCLRTGLSADQIDVTDLAGVATPLRAMSAGVNSARSVVDMLASAYYFTSSLSDKIYFRQIGGDPVVTIPYEDMSWGVDNAEPSLQITQANELEIPAQTALTYWNVDSDYQSDTQYSDRLLTGQDSTSVTQVPLAFTASEAKKITDANVSLGAVRAVSTTVTLSLAYAHLQPGNVFIGTDEDGSTFRLFIQSRRDANHVLTLDCLLDDAGTLDQLGITSGGTASQTVVSGVANTTLALLDIPLLRDADNVPGHYLAIKGQNTSWPNAGLYRSLDDVTFDLQTTVADQTVIGSCSTTLGDWTGGTVFDETNTLTVVTGIGQLASATRDQILNSTSVNAAAVGSELIQFRDATLVSAGVYTLSGLLRGRRGTEWAMTGHASAEPFVVLGLSGLRFMPLDSSELGRLFYYKAVTAGQRLSTVVAKSITPLGVGLEPFSPVDARVDRTTTDHVISWKRRTRLSTRLVGPLAISAPLGEASESYEVDIFISSAAATAGTPVLRTLASTTASVTYTAANRTTDGTGSAVVYMRIYQLSATVGRGYPFITSA